MCCSNHKKGAGRIESWCDLGFFLFPNKILCKVAPKERTAEPKKPRKGKGKKRWRKKIQKSSCASSSLPINQAVMHDDDDAGAAQLYVTPRLAVSSQLSATNFTHIYLSIYICSMCCLLVQYQNNTNISKYTSAVFAVQSSTQIIKQQAAAVLQNNALLLALLAVCTSWSVFLCRREVLEHTEYVCIFIVEERSWNIRSMYTQLFPDHTAVL